MNLLKGKKITDVPYFKACGVHAGLKKKEKKDMCVIYSEKKAVAAATFTKNKVKAAPLIFNIKNIENDNTQAIIVNSGNANACTGKKGLEDAAYMAKTTAECLGLKQEEILVASTGVIGVKLPMDIIIPGIKDVCSHVSYDGADDASHAIMTTDTFPKNVSVETTLSGKKVLISAMAKGSGMIHPNMGTMLSFIVTDANISKSMLSKVLKDSIEDSYNMISVDGDTSTNDMVIVLANGAAENKIIDTENDDYKAFKEALDFLNKEVAKMIAKDGEGSTKLIEAQVHNARTLKDAKLCAKSIITSSLVKAAIFGSDANWGRIMCALGYGAGEFVPDKVDIWFKSESQKVQVVLNGAGIDFDEDLAKKILDNETVDIIVDLKDGNFSATAWGCDLTYDYVKINGAYRT